MIEIARRAVALGKEARRDYRFAADWDREWFGEQRAFCEDQAQLVAGICGRRAGKSRGKNRDFVRKAGSTPNGRFVYINETRAEAEKIAWTGARGDGMLSLCERNGVPHKANHSKLTLFFPQTDAYIYLIGADDEAGVRKALGVPYHEVWWDEAQKIPPKLDKTITEVLMPTLLDYRGRLVLTGTPTRHQTGIFYDVTQPDVSRRRAGWSVHAWNLLANPFFGATHDERWERGVVELCKLLGGVGIDDPIVRREVFGEWTSDDAAYVYWANKIARDALCYAPARHAPNGFPDLAAAVLDLPFDHRTGALVLSADLGYTDDFAFVVWAWHPRDPVLYEVASYKCPMLDSDQQFALLAQVRDTLPIAWTVADAGGGGLQSVKGWSKRWQDRYNAPIIEAEKTGKNDAIAHLNADILHGKVKTRDGGALLAEWLSHQWAAPGTAGGRLIESPSTANHVSDAGLYGHRHSYHFRHVPAAQRIKPGTAEWFAQIEDRMEGESLEG